jgi:acyl-CoA synthetase (AMP-forming)/AMP-acid ligase II
MDREIPTELSAQPGMIKQLREHPRLAGGTLNPALTALLDKRLTNRRSDQASRGLGMTETFGQHSIETRFDDVPDDKLEAFGRRVPDMERRLRNPQTGQWADPGAEGVLWVRGPNMMAGLYKKERHEAFDSDGYYNTGDLCSIDDDGYLYFKGRSTEMIKTSGANVAPREVEVALESYPGIQEASVFGVAGEGHDAIVTAVVVPKPGASIDPEELRKQMRRDVASFKVPKTIFVLSSEDAPRTGSGKLHKPKLREMFSRPAA